MAVYVTISLDNGGAFIRRETRDWESLLFSDTRYWKCTLRLVWKLDYLPWLELVAIAKIIELTKLGGGYVKTG